VWNSGEPAAWAELEWSHELGRGGQGTADEAGAFELTGLPPGQVTLVAYPAGRPGKLAWVRESVVVDPGKVREAVLELHWNDSGEAVEEAGFDLRLRLLHADGTPAEGAYVRLSTAGRLHETAADGSVRLRGQGELARVGVRASWRDFQHEWEVSTEPGIRELRLPELYELAVRAVGFDEAPVGPAQIHWRRSGQGSFRFLDPFSFGFDLESPLRLVTDASAVDLWVRAPGYVARRLARVRPGTLADPRTLDVELRRGEELPVVGDPAGDDPPRFAMVFALTKSEFDERLALQGKRVLDPSVRFPGKTLAERIVYTDGFRSIGGLAPGEYWFMTHPDTFRVEPSSVVVPILDGRPVTLRCVYPDQGHPDHWGERR